MISLSLGNIGSGKTACVVRDLKLNPSERMTFSNIRTKGINLQTINDVLYHQEEFFKKLGVKY